MPCVCIEKNGKEIARGRIVAATNSMTILFDPLTGHVQRIPTTDATIHTLSSLDKEFASEAR